MKPKVAKRSEVKSSLPNQSKLTDYSASGEVQKASINEKMAEEVASEDGDQGSTKVDKVLAAISSIKAEISSRFDAVIAAIESMRKEISDCTEQVSQTELRISNAEDEVANLQGKVRTPESKNKSLEDKLLDLETRLCLNNLRLVNLPEGIEGKDPESFLEKWIPDPRCYL